MFLPISFENKLEENWLNLQHGGFKDVYKNKTKRRAFLWEGLLTTADCLTPSL